ncbi:MAG: O-Antigen Polymerase family [uncultured bacterium]|nr:MAG: O-Antigen Polymerase family [uncultured bacterium]OGH14623.1 MAG: hypothetical protein A2687_03680 [Candidatus Levybacteria bacterium RIFCSPHIGHO2_01_FULL_38_26]
MKFDIRISNIIFYLLILFLPTQFGRHFWPDFSYIAGIRIDYLSPALYLTDILIFLLFVFWLINKIRSKKKEVIIHDSKFMVFSALVVFLILGILFSKNQAAGWYGLLKLVELIFLGFYTAINIKKIKINIVLILLSVGLIFESFLATVQYLQQSSVDGIFYFFGERTFNGQTPGIANASIGGELFLRPYGTFPHPNVLAGYLIVVMTMIISKFNPSTKLRTGEQKSKLIKILFLGSLTFGTIALFLTMSRIAIVLWMLIVGLWFIQFSVFNLKFKMKYKNLINKNSMKISNFKLKILTLVLVASVLFLSPLHSRFTDLKLTDESVTIRQELIKSSVFMIKENPIFGVGINNYLDQLPYYQRINNYFTDLQPVHNIYFLVAAQTGIVGLAFFIWFIFKTYQRIKNTTQNSKLQKNLYFINSSSLIIILSSILILGLFDHYFLTLQQGQLIFSFTLGLCWIKQS